MDPQLLATTIELSTLLRSFGKLTLDDRKLIVDQAMVLLRENYVHLLIKRAMQPPTPCSGCVCCANGSRR